MSKKARAIDPNNREVSAFDTLLNNRPPSISWRRKRNGVWVATKVRDLHAETGAQIRAEQAEAAREAAIREAAEFLLQMREQAAEVAERFEKHRADNTPLMNAARATI